MSKVKIIQTIKEFEPYVSDDWSYFDSSLTKAVKYSKDLNVKYIGHYKNGYDYNSIIVYNKVVRKYDHEMNLDNFPEVLEGHYITRDGTEFKVEKVVYDLEGNKTYYIESHNIKCENYDKLYEEKVKEAKELYEKRLDEYEKPKISIVSDSKKSKKSWFNW